MKEILIRQIPENDGANIRLKGWVVHHRSSGKLVFVELRDGSGYVQCVAFKGELEAETFETAKNLSLETSVIIEGVVRRDDRAKIGFEVGITSVDVICKPQEEYPISPKEHGVAFLLDKRHLWLRSSRQIAIMRIRSTIEKSIHKFFDSEGFIRFDTPIFTPASCEGTTTLFETPYFDNTAYLTQSGQLYLEAGAMAHGKVYSFGPAFRAEKSKTRRHLTEFWMVEPEMAFCDLEKNMTVAEDLVAFIVKSVLDNNEDDLALIERDISKLSNIKTPFPKITYDDAIDLLQKVGKEIQWGEDFGADEETVISNEFEKPVFIHRYPAVCKPFYMKTDPESTKHVLNCDMLAPEGYGEVIGGGQREDDYDVLKSKIAKQGLDEGPLEWYLDVRKYGSVEHAGFGLGIERSVAWICGLHHVRETIPFPRMMERMEP